MFKLFHKKRNKKGFTLAELLVVVAIVAILVAIAIPIFMGSLNDAQRNVNLANIRSVKAAGVNEILTNWSKYSENTNGWQVSAYVDASGNVTNVTISTSEASLETSVDGVKTSETAAFAKKTTPYTVKVGISTTETSSGS